MDCPPVNCGNRGRARITCFESAGLRLKVTAVSSHLPAATRPAPGSTYCSRRCQNADLRRDNVTPRGVGALLAARLLRPVATTTAGCHDSCTVRRSDLYALKLRQKPNVLEVLTNQTHRGTEASAEPRRVAWGRTLVAAQCPHPSASPSSELCSTESVQRTREGLGMCNLFASCNTALPAVVSQFIKTQTVNRSISLIT